MSMWREELATGFILIDDQHKEFLSRFDRILAAQEKGQGFQEVHELLLFLENYARFHFQSEEELMQRSGWPDTATHKALHQEFIRDLTSMISQFQARGPTADLTQNLIGTLLEWLINHILQEDLKMAAAARAKVRET